MPNLLKQIYAAGTPRESKADNVEYYQEKYPGLGKGGWKQNLIHDLLGQRDITRGSVGEKEYKRLAKNMSRRFDSGEKNGKRGINNPEPRNAAEYKSLGATLPPKPPGGGYHITGTIWFKYADQPCEDREVDEIITGGQAQELANMAYDDMLQSVLNHYMSNDGTKGSIHNDEPMLATSSECAESDLTVEAIEE